MAKEAIGSQYIRNRGEKQARDRSSHPLTAPPAQKSPHLLHLPALGVDDGAQMGAVPESSWLDALFLRQMIPQRQGASRAARHARRYEVSTGLAPLLRSATDTQSRELAQLRTLLSQRSRQGCQGT